mmetsp:Transcript_10956/g.21442  ORF Transcript_10956/g.21442 Transcript_10956/m.21442 type:complete len:260 (+) Transcript_10956:3448-4227(+)
MSREMTPDQERHFRSILDRGLDMIIKDDHSEASPELLSVHSASRLSYDIPSVKPQVGNLQDELSSLQEKITALESRLHRDSPVEEKPIHVVRKRSTSSGRSKASPKQLKRVGSSDKLLKNIARSEKELTRLESSLTRSPRNASMNYETEGKKSEIARLKKLNSQLTKEIDGLRKKLNEKEDLAHKFKELQQDYNALAQSFERSEQIRRKQKAIIEQLKSALTFDADETQGRPATSKPKVVVKRKRSARRSRSNQRGLVR